MGTREALRIEHSLSDRKREDWKRNKLRKSYRGARMIREILESRRRQISALDFETCERWRRLFFSDGRGEYSYLTRAQYKYLSKWHRLQTQKWRYRRPEYIRGSIHNEPDRPGVSIWKRVEQKLK